jgi:HEAT repeat protein
MALGFFAGQRSLFDLMPGNGSPVAEPVFSAVRSVQADASGAVQIALDETRRRTVKGNLEDDRISRLLLAAARDEANPGLRVESIEILKNYSESDQVRAALIHALTHDSNPGVRLKAIEGLKDMASHPEVRRTLAQVLQKDDNAGVRIQAIDLLVQQRDDAIVGLLQGLIGREDNNYVRMRCKNALEEMNASVGTF